MTKKQGNHLPKHRKWQLDPWSSLVPVVRGLSWSSLHQHPVTPHQTSEGHWEFSWAQLKLLGNDKNTTQPDVCWLWSVQKVLENMPGSAVKMEKRKVAWYKVVLNFHFHGNPHRRDPDYSSPMKPVWTPPRWQQNQQIWKYLAFLWLNTTFFCTFLYFKLEIPPTVEYLGMYTFVSQTQQKGQWSQISVILLGIYTQKQRNTFNVITWAYSDSSTYWRTLKKIETANMLSLN